jgi:HSP20 family protein
MAKRTRQHLHNPFRGFLDVMSEMNRMQHHWMLKDNPEVIGDRTHATAWVPHADIFALGGDLVIRCELAGMRPGDVDVTVSSGVLTISGERKNDLQESDVVFHTRERVYGAFRRSMMLPEGVSQGDVVANMQNGLLEVTVKGAASSKPHQVRVEEGAP